MNSMGRATPNLRGCFPDSLAWIESDHILDIDMRPSRLSPSVLTANLYAKVSLKIESPNLEM